MDFQFSEEQEELRLIARSFLEDHSSSEQVRKAMQSELGYDPEVWRQVGAELGWTSVTIPEEYGGLGLSYVELIALLEVTGEFLFCSPFFSSICLAANALIVGGTEEQKQALLPGIAEGETRATLAYTEANGRWDCSGVEAIAKRDGESYVLSGVKTYVPDGHSADLLIVAARAEGSRGDAGLSLFAVPAATAGIERKMLPTVDQTRKQAEVRLSDVRVPASALMGEEGQAAGALNKTLDLAAIAASAEQVGGAQKCLDMAVAYSKEREQFGRPIGSFQAIKHKCADMMVRVECARSASYYAGCVAAEDGDGLAVEAALAKAYCSDAYFRCAADSLQIHGGVGFHLGVRRASVLQASQVE